MCDCLDNREVDSIYYYEDGTPICKHTVRPNSFYEIVGLKEFDAQNPNV